MQQAALASAGLLLADKALATGYNEFPRVRVTAGLRKFSSPAVEALIEEIKKQVPNKELAWLFENCFANTLDTTVDFEIIDGKPDTFVITGDIDAMWLRDSSAQVWPYLPLMKADPELQQLIKGVINRQVKCILKDPYANAFYKDESRISEWKDDKTLMKPGVHERKWEIDSLCYPIRLAHGYYRHTQDATVFDAAWQQAMKLVIQTFTEQQRLESPGPYTFQRTTSWATDSVPLGGTGYPTKKTGLIHSMFRPSDDAAIFPFLIPSNLFARQELQHLQFIFAEVLRDPAMLSAIKKLSDRLEAGLKNITVQHPVYGKVYPYETDGFGNHSFMDDANVPSLLSLPYLTDFIKNTDPTYINTRKMILSDSNPFFFKGKAAEGVGGPHVGLDYIWPLSITMRGLTSMNLTEIKKCLQLLQTTHAGSGFMHESFHKDDATKFTRKWFAWANTLFGEFVWKVYRDHRELLRGL
ncbi:MAG: metal-independent alpha-mannosidase [Ferruginibacter sp.]|nr:metal-independent alpha-mannosidase [Ferruginibacter sp.]